MRVIQQIRRNLAHPVVIVLHRIGRQPSTRLRRLLHIHRHLDGLLDRLVLLRLGKPWTHPDHHPQSGSRYDLQFHAANLPFPPRFRNRYSPPSRHQATPPSFLPEKSTLKLKT